MSYLSYAENEFKLVPEFLDVKAPVLSLLKIIEGQGHSGGSMGVFSGMFKQWRKDPHELEGNELFSPIWNQVKNLKPDLRDRVLEVTGKLMTFTPLSDLTGEDSEWVIHDYDDHCYAQSNRMYNVFKRRDGSAYWSDGVVRYAPTESYSDFIGFTGKYSLVNITFPFNPATEPKREFYIDPDYSQLIPENQDPKDWLKHTKQIYRLGYNVNNPDEIVEQAFFLTTQNQLDNFFVLFDIVYDLLNDIDEEHFDYFLSDLIFYIPRDQAFKADLKTVLNIDFDYSNLLSPDDFECEDFKWNADDGELIINNVSFVRNLIRLLTASKTIEDFDPNENLIVTDVYKPDEHYQKWVRNGCFTIHVTNGDEERVSETAFYSDKRFIKEDRFKYLFNKCKELGLEYKGPKK